ncbi:MAG: DNA recombination protein RmuC [Eubacteriaceae bacterium]|nr:DNA recombination protein RmuC [Eubacteriaceae bacterium]
MDLWHIALGACLALAAGGFFYNAAILKSIRQSIADGESLAGKSNELINGIEAKLRDEMALNRKEISASGKESRQEQSQSFATLGNAMEGSIGALSSTLSSQLAVHADRVKDLAGAVEEKIAAFQEMLSSSERESRSQMATSLSSFEKALSENINAFNTRQREQYSDLARLLSATDTRVSQQLAAIRAESSEKLEEIRGTVEENLRDTVEKRFNEQFGIISEQLDRVHKGLGEMQQLATGVGDLKKALTNIKQRGTIGEIQLGAMLEQMLAPSQYEAQAAISGKGERVDFAIKLPDKNAAGGQLLLPIDSKFPMEGYQRLLDAYEDSRSEEELRKASSAFEQTVKRAAKSIHDKYIDPPITTDFAIMFVPTEGLYSEAVKRPSLFESIQRDYKVVIVGPTNLYAFLNSLQMGFRTLAIEKRSNEVWVMLGDIKKEFGKFGSTIDSVRKKLDAAAKEIDHVGTRTRAINRKLSAVELASEDAELLAAEEIAAVEAPE